jgi:hypothetical protein
VNFAFGKKFAHKAKVVNFFMVVREEVRRELRKRLTLCYKKKKKK